MSLSKMPQAEIERRTYPGSVGVRGSSTGLRRVGGYAAIFNSRSQPLGGFREIVEPSFFNKALKEGWAGVLARFQHDDRMILGATRSGTLRLKLDDVGLDYEVDLPDTTAGHDVFTLTQRGDLAGSSMAFQCFDEDWSPSDGGYPVRHLISGRLIDVAPVSLPAYSDTTINLRRSFARFFDAPESDVAEYEQRGGLGKFFPRNRSRMMRTRGHSQPVRSIRQRQVELMAMRWDTPRTPQQERVEAMRVKTRYERELELLAMRWT